MLGRRYLSLKGFQGLLKLPDPFAHGLDFLMKLLRICKNKSIHSCSQYAAGIVQRRTCCPFPLSVHPLDRSPHNPSCNMTGKGKHDRTENFASMMLIPNKTILAFTLSFNLRCGELSVCNDEQRGCAHTFYILRKIMAVS